MTDTQREAFEKWIHSPDTKTDVVDMIANSRYEDALEMAWQAAQEVMSIELEQSKKANEIYSFLVDRLQAEQEAMQPKIDKINRSNDADIKARDNKIESLQAEIAQLKRPRNKTSITLPKDCLPVGVDNPTIVRFKHYKPDSQQFKKGISGRWQEWNGFGWDNCKIQPKEWYSIEVESTK